MTHPTGHNHRRQSILFKTDARVKSAHEDR